MKNHATNDSSHYTRRTFLKTSGVAAAGLAAANYSFAAPKTETLAASGGAKTVTFPEAEHSALTRWPRYGEAERGLAPEPLARPDLSAPPPHRVRPN